MNADPCGSGSTALILADAVRTYFFRSRFFFSCLVYFILFFCLHRDVEDKGWWKGELDGRLGVFPDNFVKLVQQESTEEVGSSSTTN